MQGQRAPEEMTLGALTLAFVQAAPLSDVTTIRFNKWGSGLNLIVSQVLHVSVSYTTHTGHSSTSHKTRYQRVAISLKEFVRGIDKYNIQHDGESKIHQRLCGHPRCDSQCRPRFFYSQPRQPPCARQLAVNPPTSPYPAFFANTKPIFKIDCAN